MFVPAHMIYSHREKRDCVHVFTHACAFESEAVWWILLELVPVADCDYVM